MRRALLACLATWALASPAWSAPYPTRTVEIVVSYGAGGSTDLVARALAQRLQDRLGQNFVVVNKPGASGTLGLTQLMRATPDGYTLYVGFTTEMAVVPRISRTIKYSVADIEPIAVTGIVPLVMIGSKRIQSDTLPDLIEELRRSPGQFTYGGAFGSPSHISGAWMNRVNNIAVTHIPYKGGAQAVGDVAGGHIDIFYGGVSVAKPAIDSGLVKAFAVTGEARSPALPKVPTFREGGLADFELGSWNVLAAPKGTPPEILDILRRATAEALASPQVRTTLADQGIEPATITDPKAFLVREEQKFARLIRELGITMGQ
jgi:tripartite-type tricarboxylate transporter receptor subunit TctC